MEPPNSSTKREPALNEAMDMAGIGEKPATRSGPSVLAVYTWAAAAISRASSQRARTRPPLPRARLYQAVFWLSSTIDPQASTGSACSARAARHSSSRRPRMYG